MQTQAVIDQLKSIFDKEKEKIDRFVGKTISLQSIGNISFILEGTLQKDKFSYIFEFHGNEIRFGHGVFNDDYFNNTGKGYIIIA